MSMPGFEKQSTTITLLSNDPAVSPFLIPWFFSSFSKPGDYITHNATESDISSIKFQITGATKGFIQLYAVNYRCRLTGEVLL